MSFGNGSFDLYNRDRKSCQEWKALEELFETETNSLLKYVYYKFGE